MCKADDAPVASLELSATRKAPADAPDPPAATAPSSTGRLGRLLGPVLLVTGALMFASANASAKVLYTHGAVNIISIFLLRSLVVYLMNAALVFAGVGGAPRSAVAGVLLLRAGSRRTHMLTLMRSLLGAGGIVTLNISFAAFLTFADAFAIFLGLATMLSILGARFLLGASERSSWRVLLGGIATVVGIVFVGEIMLESGDPKLPHQYKCIALSKKNPRPHCSKGRCISAAQERFDHDHIRPKNVLFGTENAF